MDKIYVDYEAPPTIREFLLKFFSCISRGGDHQIRTSVATYSDMECESVQCVCGRYRSFDDMLAIVNTYYPDTQPETLVAELIDLPVTTENGRRLYLYPMYCSDINKSVMLYYYSINEQDVVAMSKGRSEWSWGELLNMIGIATASEFRERVKRTEVVTQEPVVV